MLTGSEDTEPINLVEYCTNLASVKDTFVTCILADQDWCERSCIEKNSVSDTKFTANFKDFVLKERPDRSRLTLFDKCNPSYILESLNDEDKHRCYL